MKSEELKNRTKKLALRVIRLVEAMPGTAVGDVLGRQIVRSAASVAANYRAACCAKSRAFLRARMGIVAEEADESGLRLELITESGQMKPARTEALHIKVGELTAIVVSSIRTALMRSATPQSALRIPPFR